ncbi:MAG: GTPase of the mitochondrial inner membrane that associates with the large ribosomal subunit [Thelocarpon impressellum]|nr:MAG: GTPase of the mitochondrial inner membrane that associates with the large ribosomal subunit [Thelocarpon impressellum]
MASARCSPTTLAPFLYPPLRPSFLQRLPLRRCNRRAASTVVDDASARGALPSAAVSDHLDPPPTDYARSMFTDRCTLSLHAGSGGHGCISFLREKYVAAGPANGGDGGSGGNVYIQAVRGETSLHKLARRGIVKAGRGKNGRGKGQGGERGDDVLVTVPVGTVVREVGRLDPVAEEEARVKLEMGRGEEAEAPGQWRRDKWLLYPSALPSEYATAEFPPLPRARRSNLAMTQPEAPIQLDLSEAMEAPTLLAAGALGGLGNPHFVSKSIPRPKYATKGESGMQLTLELELKLLADVGLVGPPNAGKSTLLRSLSRSRARVGDWAFTTLQPNIGTVVLDNHKGRPALPRGASGREPRTHFTIADIPGLIEDAHLDRGLGLGFLRHIERARVLAFVVDLGGGDAVAALTSLWRELEEYEAARAAEARRDDGQRLVEWAPLAPSCPPPATPVPTLAPHSAAPIAAAPSAPPRISEKAWFVVGTKADRPGAEENYARLVAHVASLGAQGKGGKEGQQGSHGMESKGRRGTREWSARGAVGVIPVSAIRGEGQGRVVDWVVGLLEGP